MKETELAEILRRMYSNAPNGEQTTAIHLFGIRYAAELDALHVSVSRVILLSGIRDSYLTEVHKGIRLAKYVELNDNIAAHGLRLP